LVYVLSDDNANPLQRTYLPMFGIHPAKAAGIIVLRKS
jgi:hypothetical protein